MAGPCLMDGDCTSFYMSGDNLRVDLVIDPSEFNAASCGINGLFVQKFRCRHFTDTHNVPTGTGVTFGLGTLQVDVESWATSHTAGTYTNVTTPTTMTYKNTTNVPELVEFGFQTGPTRFHLRVGWDFEIGVKMTWSGAASIAPATELRTPIGLRTGGSVYDPAYTATGLDTTFGLTYPPAVFNQWCNLAPGETLSLTRSVYASYGAYGAPDGADNQYVNMLYGGGTYVSAWTRG